MGYQALYRVFRPQQFEDVVGQEHITKTLQNALLQKKFSHAYLFSGPRGTGKTSAAKIFAKAVNCEHAPVEEPCNECAACKGITNGSISDVIEIDAASNNGVDEIRDIRDKVKFAPSAVTYKVYIIDEVHMLSIGAFNALLKTLEEPPAHCIFILATTEPHKIPLTIISRCQRFDFKRITSKAIVGRMKTIVDAEQLKVEEGALDIIASAADGGMRDALSLLDQAV
ncbi:DNA polymerase III subunit gamma/tau, partial [Bacillus velezensis]